MQRTLLLAAAPQLLGGGGLLAASCRWLEGVAAPGASAGQHLARLLHQHGNASSVPLLQRGLAVQASTAPTGTVKATAESIPLRTGRPRLVVLGTGWASARLLRDIDPKLYDLTVISPRNHMVFTPLLASTTVGTLEPRSVAVHMTDIQRALFQPQNALFIAEAVAVFPERKAIECRSDDGLRFYVNYDKLAIATGSQGSTFGVPGVHEHCHFLRDVKQAEAIRLRLIENLALAGIPGRQMEDWQRLLHIVIVGGGPTGVEVAGELTDFIASDLMRVYPERARAMRITLIEAKELLGSFDATLREYAARKLVRRGVALRKGVVKQVDGTSITLQDGSVIPYGLCIWSTGVGPTPFTTSLPLAKTAMGRLAVDGHLRAQAPPKVDAEGHARAEGEPVKTPGAAKDGKVNMLADESRPPSAGAAQQPLQPVPDIYAMGDCCANPANPLPALAQVAEQQGRYLAAVLNEEARRAAAAKAAKAGTPPAAAAGSSSKQLPNAGPDGEFVYKSLGSMATVGGHSAVLELAANPLKSRHLSMAGFVSWVAWRSAYLTRLGSIPKRIAVAFDWTMTLVFGRDMSRW